MTAEADIAHPMDGVRLEQAMSAVKGKVRHWEWAIAAFLTVLWSAAILTYGMGYFGVFEDDVARRGATFLEVILFTAALVAPIGIVWFGAYFLRQMSELRADTAELSASVGLLTDNLKVSDPANRTEILTAVKETSEAALRAEQQRIGTHFRTLGDQQEQLVVAMKTLMQRAGADQQALQSLVETAQDVAEKAKRKAEAINKSKMKSRGGRHGLVDGMDIAQEMLPLDGPATEPETIVEWSHLNRALNFPHDAEDVEGFAAIKRFLSHRVISQALQASEDVLTMLAQEGIYMDDLRAETANPDLWRAFAGGARGDELAEMATIEDQAAFTLTRGRMRTDQIFKDATHHFVRQFDKVLDAYIDEASDKEIRELAQTRSGLAFTMLATINGAFS